MILQRCFPTGLRLLKFLVGAHEEVVLGRGPGSAAYCGT